MYSIRDNLDEKIKLAEIRCEQNEYKPKMTFAELRASVIARNPDDFMTLEEINEEIAIARKEYADTER